MAGHFCWEQTRAMVDSLRPEEGMAHGTFKLAVAAWAYETLLYVRLPCEKHVFGSCICAFCVSPGVGIGAVSWSFVVQSEAKKRPFAENRATATPER